MKSRGAHTDRLAAIVALEVLGTKEIKGKALGKRKVDQGLIEKGKQGIYIASLDREIKRNCPNRVVINAAKNNLEIERD